MNHCPGSTRGLDTSMNSSMKLAWNMKSQDCGCKLLISFTIQDVDPNSSSGKELQSLASDWASVVATIRALRAMNPQSTQHVHGVNLGANAATERGCVSLVTISSAHYIFKEEKKSLGRDLRRTKTKFFSSFLLCDESKHQVWEAKATCLFWLFSRRLSQLNDQMQIKKINFFSRDETFVLDDRHDDDEQLLGSLLIIRPWSQKTKNWQCIKAEDVGELLSHPVQHVGPQGDIKSSLFLSLFLHLNTSLVLQRFGSSLWCWWLWPRLKETGEWVIVVVATLTSLTSSIEGALATPSLMSLITDPLLPTIIPPPTLVPATHHHRRITDPVINSTELRPRAIINPLMVINTNSPAIAMAEAAAGPSRAWKRGWFWGRRPWGPASCSARPLPTRDEEDMIMFKLEINKSAVELPTWRWAGGSSWLAHCPWARPLRSSSLRCSWQRRTIQSRSRACSTEFPGPGRTHPLLQRRLLKAQTITIHQTWPSVSSFSLTLNIDMGEQNFGRKGRELAQVGSCVSFGDVTDVQPPVVGVSRTTGLAIVARHLFFVVILTCKRCWTSCLQSRERLQRWAAPKTRQCVASKRPESKKKSTHPPWMKKDFKLRSRIRQSFVAEKMRLTFFCPA